jgi:hypothetical protein
MRFKDIKKRCQLAAFFVSTIVNTILEEVVN